MLNLEQVMEDFRRRIQREMLKAGKLKRDAALSRLMREHQRRCSNTGCEYIRGAKAMLARLEKEDKKVAGT